MHRPREARQTAEMLLLNVHCTFWSVRETSTSCTHACSTRIMLRDDITTLYLATMIDHDCYICWLQRGRALTEQQQKPDITCMISNSGAGHPRNITQHIQCCSTDASIIPVTGGAAIITLLRERKDRHSSCATLPWVHTPPAAGYTEHDHC